MINTHIAPAWSPGLSPEIPTFSSILGQSGYALDYVGKWHVHKELTPCDFGFDRYEKGGGKYEIVPGSKVNVDFGNGHRQLVAATNGCSEEEAPLWQRTQTGIRAMRERANQKRPFFLRIDMPEPHFEKRSTKTWPQVAPHQKRLTEKSYYEHLEIYEIGNIHSLFYFRFYRIGL
jgi:arylsulfatase A-like enzyme